MTQDRFFAHPTSVKRTSQGVLEVPVFYRDATVVQAYFRVDADRAEDALALTPYVPVRFATGFALAGLAFFDYRECTAGAYRECALAVAASPRAWKPPVLPLVDMLRGAAHRAIGYYVLDLPVTTPLADAAGRELWGLPKFVTGIELEVQQDRVRCSVSAPGGGEPIVTLDGRIGLGVTLPSLGLLIDSVLDGKALRAVVDVRGQMRTGLGGGIEVRVGSDSPMTQHLRELGLDGVHPALVQACDHAQLVLHGGESLGAVRIAA